MGRRAAKRLTQVTINSLTKPDGYRSGYHADGDGLYLQVSTGGTSSWVLRYSLHKRAREMGLGSTKDWTLAEAREQARKYRQLLSEGIDPISHRQAERERQHQAAAQRRTFEQCAREYHTLHAHGWKNVKHAAQWINTLITYAFPRFGDKDVSAVSKADILAVLEPIWLKKTETASRVRQRIRAVLDWAAARDYRLGHDPQLWDQIARALPDAKDVKKTKHFAACPYRDVHSVLDTIQQSGAGDAVKRAIEYLILTAVRSGDVRGAQWSEIDFQHQRWVVPPSRQKSGREHRIPLSPRALELLHLQREATGASPLVFPGKHGQPMSDMTFTEVLRRLNFTFTIHGFRSSFRDWCAEQTAYPREVAEAALAHANANGDATEASYFRSDLFERRRQLMNAWANFCATEKPAAHVVSIASR